jgi:AraC-like DNA-binding protein
MDKLSKDSTNHCTLQLKNMLCSCCLTIVSRLLEDEGAQVEHITPGEVTFIYAPDNHSEAFYTDLLAAHGFESIHGREEQIVEHIKQAVVELVHEAGNVNSIIRNSDYLVERLGLSYTYLSSVFTNYENLTLERYIILHKIEKVKALIDYDELTLSEIAIQLGYSSVQYLSNQFRQVTGLTVSEYKKYPGNLRIPIDQLGKPLKS